jgi:histidinol dehydrogenase
MPRLHLVDLRRRREDLSEVLRRPAVDADVVRGTVEEVIDRVRRDGDRALRELTARFDGVEIGDLVVPTEMLEDAADQLDAALREAVSAATDQVRRFHEQARPQDWRDDRDGRSFGVRFSPLRSVGAYVPGGVAPLPSSVYMTAVPAQVAGVEEVVLCTPPTGGDGWPDRTILAVARIAGVDRVVRVGGAQAIAALAYGTESVPAVDRIVGPGNRYVAAAKLLVQASGRCGIDGFAGPTEVAILADGSADPRVVAADLVAQAEHDELASCLLVTPDPDLVSAVEDALDAEVAAARHRERIEAALAGQGTAVLVADLAHGLEVVDTFAPEHLEVQTEDAEEVAGRVRYAGAIFIGGATPVSLGDYAAGPNHTLPTARTARFRGGLTTTDFLVPVNWVSTSPDALAALAPIVRAMSTAEDLPAHGRAVDVRLDG